MTGQELALLALLPEKWQDILLGYEAEMWFRRRMSARVIARGFSREGGSISISPTATNPDSLPEPLRDRVMNLDFHYRQLTLAEIDLDLESDRLEKVLTALKEAGIETVAQWRDTPAVDRHRIPILGRKTIQILDKAIQQHITNLILSSMVQSKDE